MKSISAVISLGLILLFSSAHGVFQEYHFSQRLMPIDQFDDRTWENRYHLDDSQYTTGGPLFVSPSASLTFNSEVWRTNTYFFDLGREMNAILLHTEHRFYTDNRPTGNTSFANLQFLDTRYAVDDLAALIEHVVEEYQPGSIILHGFDHGGAIAVWLAHRYPNLYDGLWASAAPVLAVKDNGEYLVNVADDIREIGGDLCYQNTQAAFNSMEFNYNTGNFAELQEKFHVCDPFTPGDAVEGAVFFANYARTMGTLIRYTHRAGVEVLCDYYETHDQPMDALADFFNIFYEGECVPISGYSQLELFGNVEWDSVSHVDGMRQFTYQNCREHGWFISSSVGQHPFGNRFPIELFQQQCQMIFGDVFTTPNMFAFYDETNRIFGGNRPNVTNAYFTYGEYDPTKNLQVTDAFNSGIIVDVIAEMGAAAEILPYGLYTQAIPVQDRVRVLFTQWIAAANRQYN